LQKLSRQNEGLHKFIIDKKMSLNRRKFLRSSLLLGGISLGGSSLFASPVLSEKSKVFKRVRPGDPGWPSPGKWDQLNKAVNGNLIKLESPLTSCKSGSGDATCDAFFKSLKNPYYNGDNPALTQSTGWLDAWRSEPSVYAVAAKSSGDVVAAVNFARENNLRLVVKGGGHSYQGTSNSADSLLIWTRAMNKIVLHENFIAQGCETKQAGQPAVSIEAGAMWLQAYDAVTTKGGRFVQGGGCATVGVAGLIQSGGFGSFSKHYGMAAAALLEAEIVTADGKLRIANACNNPDLFWALKGGGGGSFGVVTRLTLRTRELPVTFGVVSGLIKAKSDAAYETIIAKLVELYHDKLFNPHWGEQIRFNPGNAIEITMLCHGLTTEQAKADWQSFEDWVKQAPSDYAFERPLMIITIPAQHLWDPAFLKQFASGFISMDDRPNASEKNIYWASNRGEAGQFLYAYRSAWLPEKLLEKENQKKLVDALFAASRHWTTTLHFNKGLAGAPPEEVVAAKDTAMNPDVLNAFALVIIAGEGDPAFTGVPGHEPDLNKGRIQAERINKAMDEIMKVAPNAGSYVSESDFFEKNWQQSFWGSNYNRLAAVKKQYDPEGLFFVHHGVGSEAWSDDGFTPSNPYP
jgi:FAD/FMN-containing dehydrogenase